MSIQILVAEDDPDINRLLSRILEQEGYMVTAAFSGSEARLLFRDRKFDLFVLDLMLPGAAGEELVEEIRKVSQVPICFLSSASDNMNIIMAVNLGGDDFICKPFDLPVLLAKIQALLRRSYAFGAPSPKLEARGAVLDTAAASLQAGGEKIPLTKNECRILQTLLEQKGRVVSRDTLMERLWQTDDYVDENALTVNVARLRRKLEQAGLDGLIVTKKGLGYLVEDT